MLALAGKVGTETVGIEAAFGRVLAETVTASRDQPPFDSSAMDGWAVAGPGDDFRIVGESAAGHGYRQPLGAGEAVRIFTGAAVPEGSTRVVIQEEATREGERVKTPPATAMVRHWNRVRRFASSPARRFRKAATGSLSRKRRGARATG